MWWLPLLRPCLILAFSVTQTEECELKVVEQEKDVAALSSRDACKCHKEDLAKALHVSMTTCVVSSIGTQRAVLLRDGVKLHGSNPLANATSPPKFVGMQIWGVVWEDPSNLGWFLWELNNMSYLVGTNDGGEPLLKPSGWLITRGLFVYHQQVGGSGPFCNVHPICTALTCYVVFQLRSCKLLCGVLVGCCIASGSWLIPTTVVASQEKLPYGSRTGDTSSKYYLMLLQALSHVLCVCSVKWKGWDGVHI